MKRYDLIEYPACGTYDKMMDERPDGDWCSFEEVQALLRAVAEEVGKMPHEQSCRAHERCKICDKPPWANDHRADIPSHHAHVFSPWGCDCPRGKVLAMLEVEL